MEVKDATEKRGCREKILSSGPSGEDAYVHNKWEKKREKIKVATS